MSNYTVQYKKEIAEVGCFSLRPLMISEDIKLIHHWVTQPYAKFWGMQDYSVQQVEEEYYKISRNVDVFLGLYNGEPVFLMERYYPANDPVGEHYSVQKGDRGMHVLVAPADRPIANFTWSVFSVVMDFLFSDPDVTRVVVEPDIRNEKIHALNKRAGFEYQKVIELSNKTAHLAFCTKEQYLTALKKDKKMINRAVTASPKFTLSPELVVSHLKPECWALVNRLHIRKAISEFAHELLVEPVLQKQEGDWGVYTLVVDQPDIEYRFRAQLLSLDHWYIDSDSIEKFVDGCEAPLDSLSFIIEFADCLGMKSSMLPTYLEEIASTLYGSAYKYTNESLSAEMLAHADFQQVESAMMEGHPTFVANNGRIGFNAIDYRAYAPEVASPVRLFWLAVHKDQTVFACSDDLSYPELLAQELGSTTLEKFSSSLVQEGVNPDNYFFMPVHPWQWYNKLASIFSADIALRKIVFLGEGEDDYQAQQSIRTFFNTSNPNKYYVKTALSILNMGFMRGLSPYYMSTTPAINDWIHQLTEQDRYLSSKGFSILREIAAIGYRNHYFENAISEDSPYKKMLSALWRESPIPQLKSGQRLMTMASLLHVDAHGAALLPELIKSSGVDTSTWLKQYLDCYMSPLLHCFYAYDLVFMPHGENLILVLENNIPVRAIMKDIAEETAIMNIDVVLSEKVQRLAVDVPEELKVLSIFTDLFDCIFRYIAHILLEHHGYPEQQFWRMVANCVLEYQQAHPEFSDKFERYDLFAQEFTRSCLNRLQLSNNQQMIDLADPAKNLKFVGMLKNPIAVYKESVRVLAEVADA